MSPKKQTKKKTVAAKATSKPSRSAKGAVVSSKGSLPVKSTAKKVSKKSVAKVVSPESGKKQVGAATVKGKSSTSGKNAGSKKSAVGIKSAVAKTTSSPAKKGKVVAAASKPTVKKAKASKPPATAVAAPKASTKPVASAGKAAGAKASSGIKAKSQPKSQPSHVELEGQSVDIVMGKGSPVTESKPPKKASAKKAGRSHADDVGSSAHTSSNDHEDTKSVAANLSPSKAGGGQMMDSESVVKKLEDFTKFRAILLALRERLKGDVHMMSQEALGTADGAVDNHAPIHPAEVGSHSFEQEFTLNLLSSDGDRLGRIEAALEKIADGSYGSCEECGGRIPKARLEIIPDTPFCVKCASKLEG